MKLKAKHYVACDRCGAGFYGPDGGDYGNWDPEVTGVTLEDYLVSEAMAMMWLRIVWGVDDVLLCGPTCAHQWLDEVHAGGN